MDKPYSDSFLSYCLDGIHYYSDPELGHADHVSRNSIKFSSVQVLGHVERWTLRARVSLIYEVIIDTFYCFYQSTTTMLVIIDALEGYVNFK